MELSLGKQEKTILWLRDPKKTTWGAKNQAGETKIEEPRGEFFGP